MDTYNKTQGNPNVLAMIMAGGQGSRLFPLTEHRAKPAVLFGGKYRIIDFVLNNFVNSGITKINVLTQFKADSLIKHINSGWQMNRHFGQYVDVVPAQMRTGKEWYQGTADAIYQNLNLINDENPDYVAVFGADHIFKMDISRMLDAHRSIDAQITVAAIPKTLEQAKEFGVIEIDENGMMIGFEEKPENPKCIPGQPDMALCSMGNYLFNKEFLVDILITDASTLSSSHDFGKDIMPQAYKNHTVFVYDFFNNIVPGETEEQNHYWEDVGTLDAYYEANMTLRRIVPQINIYNDKWPVRTADQQTAPVKFIFGSEDTGDNRCGQAIDTILSGGCIISGGIVKRSVLANNIRVDDYSEVEDSIIFNDVMIGKNCKIKKAIIDKGAIITDDSTIGFNKEDDLAKGYTVTENGITIVS